MTYSKTNPEDIDPACEEDAVKALMYAPNEAKGEWRHGKVHWAH
jgi:hypothetical protein